MHRCHLRRFEQLGSLRVSVSERHAVTTSVRIGIDFGLSVLTVALAACSGSVAPGLPTIVFTDPAPPTILEVRSEEHTSELQSQSNLVCRLLLEKKKKKSIQQRAPSDTAHVSTLV